MYVRHIAQPLQEALADTPVVVVNGARQTGKHARELRDIHVASFKRTKWLSRSARRRSER
jgi:hypothetical protein